MLARRDGVFRIPMELVNHVYRQYYENQYCDDFETLALWLKETGFHQIQRVDIGRGAWVELLIDRDERRFSLYVEAQKGSDQSAAATPTQWK